MHPLRINKPEGKLQHSWAFYPGGHEIDVWGECNINILCQKYVWSEVSTAVYLRSLFSWIWRCGTG